MITHRNLFAQLRTLARVCGCTAESGIFNGLVLAHADGLVQGPVLAAACGCRLVRPPPFAPQGIESHLDMVRAHRATHMISVPSIYSFIDRYARHDDYFAEPEFQALVSVAAKPVPGAKAAPLPSSSSVPPSHASLAVTRIRRSKMNCPVLSNSS